MYRKYNIIISTVSLSHEIYFKSTSTLYILYPFSNDIYNKTNVFSRPKVKGCRYTPEELNRSAGFIYFSF